MAAVIDDTPIKKTEEKKTRLVWKESKMGCGRQKGRFFVAPRLGISLTRDCPNSFLCAAMY
jgi:hypothetical protein